MNLHQHLGRVSGETAPLAALAGGAHGSKSSRLEILDQGSELLQDPQAKNLK